MNRNLLSGMLVAHKIQVPSIRHSCRFNQALGVRFKPDDHGVAGKGGATARFTLGLLLSK